MGFVNEYMSKEDIEKYRIKELDKRFWVGHYKPMWTVDRERDAYLRYLRCGREDTAGRIKFYFYWKGHEVLADLIVKTFRHGENRPGNHYSIHEIQIPEEVASQRKEILSDLKDALTEYKDNGILSRSNDFKFLFDF